MSLAGLALRSRCITYSGKALQLKLVVSGLLLEVASNLQRDRSHISCMQRRRSRIRPPATEADETAKRRLEALVWLRSEADLVRAPCLRSPDLQEQRVLSPIGAGDIEPEACEICQRLWQLRDVEVNTSKSCFQLARVQSSFELRAGLARYQPRCRNPTADGISYRLPLADVPRHGPSQQRNWRSCSRSGFRQGCRATRRYGGGCRNSNSSAKVSRRPHGTHGLWHRKN
mmetsp:Transcript_49199/g.101482  ORF Transcript_49199/g.101482 Transcript_49199/m.101482 type:complete len:229 (+) Transcript_49199:89-775(+)